MKNTKKPTYEDFLAVAERLTAREVRLVLTGIRYMEAHKGASVDECMAYALEQEKGGNGNG